MDMGLVWFGIFSPFNIFYVDGDACIAKESGVIGFCLSLPAFNRGWNCNWDLNLDWNDGMTCWWT